MPKTEAQKRANTKYQAKKYASKTVRLDKIYNEEIFLPYVKKRGFTENGFIVNAIKYCIDNNIDLTTTQDSDKDNH